jgi:hypothetical protein
MRLRALAALAVASSLAALAGSAAGAPTWLEGATLSAAGSNAIDPSVAMSSQGEVLVLWSRFDGSDFRIEFSNRSPGGTFADAQTVSGAGASATLDHVAADGAGNFVAVWRRNDGTFERIEYADKPAGGPGMSFTEPKRITPDAQASFESNPSLAVAQNGDAIVAFRKGSGADRLVMVATRPAGGVFGIQTVSASGIANPDLTVGAGGAGDAVALWTLSDGTHDRIQAAIRPAGGTFSQGVNISDAATDAARPQVAVDSAGNAVAVWEQAGRVQAAVRPAGGSFGPAAPISDAGQTAAEPQIAMDAAGNALVVWDRSDAANKRVQVAVRPAGGSFGPADTVSAAGQNATQPHVVADPLGNAVIAWKRSDGSKQRVQAVIRSVAGTYGDILDVSAAGQDADQPLLAGDAQGNGVATFFRSDGTNQRMTAAGLDNAGPLISGSPFPNAGTAGAPVGFAASASDVWSSVGSFAWDFGDGGQATGTPATHTYATAGTFTAKLTVTDSVGTASTGSAPIAITAPASIPVLQQPPQLLPGACATKKTGTRRADILTGTPRGDLIRGGAGNDRISGGAGADCLFGQAGNDKLSGGAGNDKLDGGPGNDNLTGGKGKDTFTAGPGNDTINSKDGIAERVNCGKGRDKVKADRRDKLTGCEKRT